MSIIEKFHKIWRVESLPSFDIGHDIVEDEYELVEAPEPGLTLNDELDWPSVTYKNQVLDSL